MAEGTAVSGGAAGTATAAQEAGFEQVSVSREEARDVVVALKRLHHDVRTEQGRNKKLGAPNPVLARRQARIAGESGTGTGDNRPSLLKRFLEVANFDDDEKRELGLGGKQKKDDPAQMDFTKGDGAEGSGAAGSGEKRNGNGRGNGRRGGGRGARGRG